MLCWKGTQNARGSQKLVFAQIWEYSWESESRQLPRGDATWIELVWWSGKRWPAERREGVVWGKVYQTKGIACLSLNSRVLKWKGQDSWCLLKCYNPLEHAIFHLGERKASGQDLQSKLSVYQAGAGVRSSKKSSPEGIKSEIERWVKVVSNGYGKRPPETAQQNSSMKMKSKPCIRGKL